MIYLIGGPPRSGKTTLAKRLAARLRIGWVSADFLEGVIREYLPTSKRADAFPKNVMRAKTDGTNDDMYARFSAVQIVRAYERQGKTCSKALESLVAALVYEKHDFVIEGYQVRPSLASKLSTRFPGEIRSVFLFKKDVPLLVSGLVKNKAKSDWAIQKTRKPETLWKIAEMLAIFGARVENEAKQHAQSAHSMDKKFGGKILALEKTLAGNRKQRRG
jgi:AAA+ ATPase superfamily predicted ATPase